MKKMIFLPAALLGLSFSAAYAEDVPVQGRSGIVEVSGSFLSPLQERDSVLIADQLRYGFRLEGVEEGTGFAFPDYSKGFRDSVEVVSPWVLDTLDFRKGRKGAPGVFTLEGSVVITSFDEGKYMLPPISVLRHGVSGDVDTLVFNPQVLEVKTIPVDTATFEIHDIKGQIRYPLTFREFLAASDPKVFSYVDSLSDIGHLPDMILNRLVLEYRRYSVCGGMPAAALCMLENKGMSAVEEELQGILDLYELDFSKYADPLQISRINALWRSLPSQLSKEELA